MTGLDINYNQTAYNILDNGWSESYAMQNAHPDLARVARYTAPSNDEDGVMRVLRERFML